MAPRERVKAQRAATPDDLKSLVQALGGLVRESVAKEMRPLRELLMTHPPARAGTWGESFQRYERGEITTDELAEHVGADAAGALWAYRKHRGIVEEPPGVVEDHRVQTITEVDHETKTITVGLREHVDGEVVAPNVGWDAEIRLAISNAWKREGDVDRASLLRHVMIDMAGQCNPTRVRQLIDEAFALIEPPAPKRERGGMLGP